MSGRAPILAMQHWSGCWGAVSSCSSATPTAPRPCYIRTLYPWTRREKASGTSTHPAHFQILLR